MSVPRAGLDAIVKDARQQEAQEQGATLGVLDQELLGFVNRHLEGEAEVLEAYQAISRESPDEYVRYVADLIAEDERRHHQLLVEMANQLRGQLDGSAHGARVPWLTRPRHPRELRAALDRLISFERHDRRELRRFRRRLGPRRRTSLLTVLVDAMLADTQKHLRMLVALRRSAKRVGRV